MLSVKVDPEAALGPHVIDLPDGELESFLAPGGHAAGCGEVLITDSVAFTLPGGGHVEPSENNSRVAMLCVPADSVGWSSGSSAVSDSLRVATNVVLSSTPDSLWLDDLLPTTCRYLRGMSLTVPVIDEVDTPWGRGLTGSVTLVDRTAEFYMLAATGPGWLVRMTAFSSQMDEAAVTMVQELMAAVVIRGHVLGSGLEGALPLLL